MFFGRARKKSLQYTVDNLRPLVGAIQALKGLPAGFWQNEFVLGFFHFMIAFNCNTSGHRLSVADKGHIFIDALTQLSNLNGRELVKRCTELAQQSPKNEMFERGADHASMICHYSIGNLVRKRGDPALARSGREHCRAAGEPW